MDSWIVRKIRDRARRRVLTWAFVLVVFMLVLLSQARYFSNFVKGPFDMNAADLNQVASVETTPRYFVRVTHQKAIDTGIQQISIEKRNGVETRRHVSATYYALVMGDKLLIAKTNAGPVPIIEGTLKPIPSDLHGRLFDTPEMLQASNRFYPFMLDNEDFKFPGYLAIAGGVVLLVCLATFGRKALRQMSNPESHKVCERVATWGDPLGVALEVEREVQSPRHTGGGWTLTDNYLVQSSFYGFNVLRVHDVLWAYKKITKHSVNFIPTGKTYAALVMCYGGTAMIAGKEAGVDNTLRFLAGRAPWAVYGFNDELSKLWNKQNADFCAAVEQRRQQGVAGASVSG